MESGTNQLIDLFDYLIDKFNIAIEIPSKQMKEFASQFADKIVSWELWMSLITVLICIGLMIFELMIYRKIFGKEKRAFIKFWKTIDANISSKDIGKVIIFVILACVLVILIPITISNIVDIIMCLVFPEKIILEFIGQYM